MMQVSVYVHWKTAAVPVAPPFMNCCRSMANIMLSISDSYFSSPWAEQMDPSMTIRRFRIIVPDRELNRWQIGGAAWVCDVAICLAVSCAGQVC